MAYAVPCECCHPWLPPTTSLAASERLFLCAFRRCVAGLRHNDGRHWHLARRDLAHALGADDAASALANFARIIVTVHEHARRRLRLHPPCCAFVSADEASMIHAVAACQHGEPARAVALAQRLLMAEGVAQLLQAGAGVAQALRRHGRMLPLRGGGRPHPHPAPPRAVAGSGGVDRSG